MVRPNASRHAMTKRSPAFPAETPSPVRTVQPSRRFTRWNRRFLGQPRVAHVFRQVLQGLPTGAAADSASAVASASRRGVGSSRVAGAGSVTLVTSVRRGEGTTTVALGLAALAGGSRGGRMVGSRVVLVETNTHAPALAERLGCAPSPGLSEWLAGIVDGNRAMRYVESYGFTVVPIGGGGPADPEIFESVRFRRLIEELTGRYDRVILDAAPITSCVDATVLSSVADNMLLVVRANKTPREAAQHACRLASQAGTHFAGIILNRRRYALPRFLYRSL